MEKKYYNEKHNAIITAKLKSMHSNPHHGDIVPCSITAKDIWIHHKMIDGNMVFIKLSSEEIPDIAKQINEINQTQTSATFSCTSDLY